MRQFKTNVILVDNDDYGFSPAIIEISIKEEDFKPLVKVVVKAKEIGISCFEVGGFHLPLDGAKDFRGYDYEEENPNGFNLEELAAHEAYIKYPEFIYNKGYIDIAVSFKHTSGKFESFRGISFAEIEKFFKEV